MTNIMRREAERAMNRLANTRIGVVSAYDENNYAARVRIQPEDAETGWLPITSPWAGNGWGDYCAPSIGDVVDVHFQEAGKEAGFIGGRHYGDEFRPLAVPSGERWIVHKSGSLLKFHNDGSAELRSDANLTISAGGTLRLTAPNIQLHATTGYRFDVDGHGQSWRADRVNTYQTGEVEGDVNPISPPEIGN